MQENRISFKCLLAISLAIVAALVSADPALSQAKAQHRHKKSSAQQSEAKDQAASTEAPAEKVPPLVLVPENASRRLPAHLLGVSIEPSFNHILNTPEQIAAAKSLHPAFVRFPGGSQSNYYQWRTGLFHIDTFPDSSEYTRFWANAMPSAARINPDGISEEQYRKFADSIGAKVVLVPNMETSSVEDQAAWFKKMKEDGSLPTHIEMGNEYYLYMGSDPNVLKIWPDEPTSMRKMHQYLEAFKPYMLPNSKVAIQSAGSSFGRPKQRHWQEWDSCLKPESWFDAVTIHLYPRLQDVYGDYTRSTAAQLFDAMMARCDGGVDRVLTQTEQLLPGKEIWITEWNPRGLSHTEVSTPITPAMQAHLTTKMILAYLRHHSVTMSIFFSLTFRGENDRTSLFQQAQNGAYVPTALAVVLHWLNEAGNGGCQFQELIAKDSTHVAGGGKKEEDYIPIEAGLFQAVNGKTLIVQNATSVPRSLLLSGLTTGMPSYAETLALQIKDQNKLLTPTKTDHPSETLLLPPYSVCRIVW